MSLTLLYEEHEVSPEVRRIYGDVRASFDLPFVPSLFKLLAGTPDYLKAVWDDLGPVARSREFQSAARALTEFAHSTAVSGGWGFADQQRVLAAQKFSSNDIDQLGSIARSLTRASATMALFARLLQKGYSGGQPGRISNGRQASALARMITLHVPAEGDAGLRVWLIYSDIRRTLGTQTVLSLFRILSPFPAYLAAVWLDCKKTLSDPAFTRARDELNKRSLALLTGIPVKDHRATARNVAPGQWRDIEEATDSWGRMGPQITLLAAIWERSFAGVGSMAA